MTDQTISKVLEKHTKKLMSLPGVVGVGRGVKKDKPCIVVLVANLTPELKKKIPQKLKGYLVVIEETGKIRVFPGD